MLKFDNDHIFTGYLKQLLSSFNLPTYRVYTEKHRKYFEKHGVESPEILPSVYEDSATYGTNVWRNPYIKDDSIQEYVFSTSDAAAYNAGTATKETELYKCDWIYRSEYYPDKKTVNTTKRLKIKNNRYDSYTHEYLGDYLRFLRDYHNYDLMPLYNCFSNRVCQTLVLNLPRKADDDAGQKILFNTGDSNYKIYMVPIKLFQEYTIAIDCNAPVELCCALYGKYQDETSIVSAALPRITYKKYGHMRFNQPILYSACKTIYNDIEKEALATIANRETDLKLFIKLPVHNSSSITILEGNYLGYNDRFTAHIEKKTYVKNYEDQTVEWVTPSAYPWQEVKNHTVTNYLNETVSSASAFWTISEYAEKFDFKPITYLTLLGYNTGVSYPFADKLVEYLSGNVITPLDQTSDNIARVQEVVGIATNGKLAGPTGIWDERLRPVLYDFMQSYKAKAGTTQELNRDVLGYVDKTLEARYSAFSYEDGEYKRTSSTIANVDLYPEMYLESKKDK